LQRAPLAGPRGYRGIPNDGRSRHARRDLFEQFEPFRANTVFEYGKTSDVAARSRQAIDEASADRIRRLREYDRHAARRLQQRRYDRAASSQDDVWRQRDQFRRIFAKAVGIAGPPARVNLQVAALGPAQLLQALQERRNAGLTLWIVGHGHEHGDPPHSLALLRARCKRPRGSRTAEQRDELAPSHSITSSARASSIAGTTRPSAFAVLRLMISSNLVGC